VFFFFFICTNTLLIKMYNNSFAKEKKIDQLVELLLPHDFVIKQNQKSKGSDLRKLSEMMKWNRVNESPTNRQMKLRSSVGVSTVFYFHNCCCQSFKGFINI